MNYEPYEYEMSDMPWWKRILQFLFLLFFFGFILIYASLICLKNSIKK